MLSNPPRPSPPLEGLEGEGEGLISEVMKQCCVVCFVYAHQTLDLHCCPNYLWLMIVESQTLIANGWQIPGTLYQLDNCYNLSIDFDLSIGFPIINFYRLHRLTN